ncbi:MAG: hypothetical protein KIT22_05775 [Verrucomicrobiae bacterium]|nr:hypothetical protein [Verrucomicrobiae bacterium]
MCGFAVVALESVTNRVFQVSPGGQLVPTLDQGSIDVTSADTDTMTVSVIREVKDLDSRNAQSPCCRGTP